MNNDIEVKNYVIRAQAGDPEAFNELDRMFRGKFFYQAMSYVNNVTDAEDIVQNAYIRAYNRIDRCIPEKYVAWMKQIVTNEALAFMKTAHARYDVDFSALEKTDDEGNIEEFEIVEERIENNPELNFETEETKRIVSEMLGALPDTQRFVFAKYYLEDKKIKEISEELSINENTIKTQLSRGKKVLREEATRIEKKYNIKLACSPVSFLVFMLKDLETAYETEMLIGGAKLTTGSLAGKKAVSTVAEVVKKAATDNAGKAAAAKITATSVGAKIAAGAIVGAIALGTLSGINDKGYLSNNYDIVSMDNVNYSEIYKDVVANDKHYRDEDGTIYFEKDVVDGFDIKHCEYSINYENEMNIPWFTIEVNNRVFELMLDNGFNDQIKLMNYDSEAVHDLCVNMNKSGAVVGFWVTDVFGDPINDSVINDERAIFGKKVNYDLILEDIETIEKCDDILFTRILNADVIKGMIIDLKTFFDNYELGTDNRTLKGPYNFDITGDYKSEEIINLIAENSQFEHNNSGVFKEVIFNDGGKTHNCWYNIHNDGMDLLFVNWRVDENNDFFLCLNNGIISDEVHIYTEDVAFKIGLNRDNDVTDFEVTERIDGSAAFDFYGYLTDEKMAYFKTINWKSLVNDVEILKKADDTVFKYVVDADELIRLFNDLDEFFNSFSE